MKKFTLARTPESYKYVLTHGRIFRYQNDKWYYVSLLVLYVVALETAGQYLIFGHSANRAVDFMEFIALMVVVVFLNDYIFYRIAKRNL